MLANVLVALTWFAAIGSGIMAGLFFTFSSFVMQALGRLPPAQGVAAMQSINVTILNPLFLALFMGTALASGILVVAGVVRWREPGALYLVAGGLLYLGGIIVVTAAANVPRNDALAALPADSAEAAAYWVRYLSSWVAWNHVRTVTGVGALVSFILALR